MKAIKCNIIVICNIINNVGTIDFEDISIIYVFEIKHHLPSILWNIGI